MAIYIKKKIFFTSDFFKNLKILNFNAYDDDENEDDDYVKLWWKLNDIGNYNDKVMMMMWNWWWQCEINDDNMWWCGIDNVKLMIMMMTY